MVMADVELADMVRCMPVFNMELDPPPPPPLLLSRVLICVMRHVSTLMRRLSMSVSFLNMSF